MRNGAPLYQDAKCTHSKKSSPSFKSGFAAINPLLREDDQSACLAVYGGKSTLLGSGYVLRKDVAEFEMSEFDAVIDHGMQTEFYVTVYSDPKCEEATTKSGPLYNGTEGRVFTQFPSFKEQG